MVQQWRGIMTGTYWWVPTNRYILMGTYWWVPTDGYLLTGTYTLRSNEAIFNQTRNTIYPLCNEEEETTSHFLLRCEALEDYRQPLLQYIKAHSRLVFQCQPSSVVAIWNSELLIQLILDPTHPTVQELLPLCTQTMIELEKLSRLLSYKLHQTRFNILESSTMKK